MDLLEGGSSEQRLQETENKGLCFHWVCRGPRWGRTVHRHTLCRRRSVPSRRWIYRLGCLVLLFENVRGWNLWKSTILLPADSSTWWQELHWGFFRIQRLQHPACAVDGSWGTWGPWALCSKTCGGGKQHRERKCDSPAPAHGGTNCTGNIMQLDDCNTILCPLPSSGKYINKCPPGWFTCKSGGITCIDASFKCDCANDCDDGSDEEISYAECKISQIANCKSGSGHVKKSWWMILITITLGVFLGPSLLSWGWPNWHFFSEINSKAHWTLHLCIYFDYLFISTGGKSSSHSKRCMNTYVWSSSKTVYSNC